MKQFHNFVSAPILKDVLKADTKIDVFFPANHTPPDFSTGGYFMAVITNSDDISEIIKVIGYDSVSKNITVERGQENTTPKDFLASNSFVEERITAAELESFFQKGVPDKAITAKTIQADRLSVLYPTDAVSESIDVELGTTGNFVDFSFGPNVDITFDGKPIYHIPEVNGESYPIGTIIYFSGDPSTLSDRWAVCDGTPPTPDLMGLFLRGIRDTNVSYIGKKVSLSDPAYSKSSEEPDHKHSGLEKTSSFTITNDGGFNLAPSDIPQHTHQDSVKLSAVKEGITITAGSYDRDKHSGSNAYRAIFDLEMIYLVPDREMNSTNSGSGDSHTHTLDNVDMTHTHDIGVQTAGGAHSHPISGSYAPNSYAITPIMRVK